MNASLRQRRALPAVVAVSLACTAIGIGTTIAAQPAQAVPSVGPNVSPTMFTGNRGTGCTYNVSVVVTDHTAPVQLLIVDEHGQVVSRLATRNERRTDQKRVVEGEWLATRVGTMRAVAIQNGVTKQTAPFPVTSGFNTGSACFGA
ncbi:hypothetical protein [Gordonia sp. UBA5067]|uniref:hypothetical protein n=1 Tax=Gordonia sp. UBA5067 TaxID=1946575 RepID=UPI0025BB6985|nr:hypothetical protein [Gordonia sp. UBA5067]